jgi:hypothetical protein
MEWGEEFFPRLCPYSRRIALKSVSGGRLSYLNAFRNRFHFHQIYAFLFTRATIAVVNLGTNTK